jgi:pyroglutamyl-peptidase
MKPVLLTGFEPFGGDLINPSAEIVRQLDGMEIGRRQVIGAVLPCVFAKATRELTRLLRQHGPALVICLGLATGRAAITPERIAINVADARIPDNEGQQPVDASVVRGGPAAYWSALPIKAIVAALQKHGIPAEVSQSAGTFVCNHVFYGLMHELARAHPRVRGGFIHVPALPLETGSRPGLPLAQMTAGIHLAIETSLRNQRDIPLPAGALS